MRLSVPLPVSQAQPQARSLLTADLAARLLFVLVLAAGLILAWRQLVPPAVIPASSPPTEFSAERAMQHIRVVAAQPHPMGSAEHEAAAAYIVEQLTALGLTPEVQETTGLRYENNQGHAARVKNIWARIPGTHSSGALLLASHYDSMPTTNAAADGGVSVGTGLETARALLAGPPLKNDVILYVGDAEVNGVLGPTAAQGHAWLKDVKAGFAFEAVGSYGPSGLIYATTRDGWWLGEALSALPHPFVMLAFNDLLGPMTSPEVYVLTEEKGAGASIGFGQFRGGEAYHSLLDNPDRLDPRGLQHAGGYALALARHFGNLALDRAEQPSGTRLIAFNVLPGRVVTYPATWAPLLAGVNALLLAGVFVTGVWRRRLSVGGLLIGLVLFVLGALAALVAGILAHKLAVAVNPVYQAWLGRGYYGGDWHLVYLTAVTVTCVTAFYLAAPRVIRAARHDDNMAAGALVVLALLMILTALALRSLSYMFTWTTLAGVLLLGWTALVPAQHPWWRAVVLALAAMATLVLFLPPVYLLYSLLSAPFLSVMSLVPMVVVALVLVALALGALLPHFHFLGGQRRWIVSVLAAAVAVVALAGEIVTARFDADQPRPNYMQYILDKDSGTATWLSGATQPDAWTQQFFPAGYETSQVDFAKGYFFGQEFPAIQGPAPVLDLPAPQAAVEEDATRDGIRSLRLHLTSPRGAPYLHLDMALPGDLVAATVDSQPIDVASIPSEQRQRFALMFYNLPKNGMDISLSVRGTGSIDAKLIDYSNGLPDIPGLAPRPAEFMPAPYDFRDPTVVRTSFKLAP